MDARLSDAAGARHALAVDGLEHVADFRASSRQSRLAACNWLLLVIASVGPCDFRRGESVAVFRFDTRQRLTYVSAHGVSYSRHDLTRPRKVPHGSTYRALLLYLAGYIDDATPVPEGTFGPWGSGSDPWGYGADMAIVRRAARRAVLLAPATRGSASGGAPV